MNVTYMTEFISLFNAIFTYIHSISFSDDKPSELTVDLKV